MTSIEPMGDQACLLRFADEEQAWRLASAVRGAARPWVVDVVQAYRSVAVFFDLAQIQYAQAAEYLQKSDVSSTAIPSETMVHHIPCCYDLELDLERVARQKGLSREDVVRLHSGTTYTVYAIGFCPGFPYLGYLPAELQGMSRLESPRLRVEPGSVGLTGNQTGIYTEARPGGWNIIGRTPLELVNVRDEYFPLRTGDRVKFVPIGQDEYHRLLGSRL
jgi:inhibitor of KinA